MKVFNLQFFILTFVALPTISFADVAAKRVYECSYDGGRDASTWQPTGEMAVPPAGAAMCMRPAGNNDYHCPKVVDADGMALGRGIYCGEEMQPDYPGVKAYE